MIDRKRKYLTISLILALVVAVSAPQIPRVKAVGGLALDSSGSGSCIGITQCTTYAPSFDTVGSTDLVILQVLLNNTGMVTSITSNQGLTWTQRAEVANGLGGKESEWFAVATQALSNPSISVTDSVSRVSAEVEIFGISGYDTAHPFDPSIKTPTTVTGTSNIISAAISTNDAYDLLLGLAYGGNGVTVTAGMGFTGICLSAPGCSLAASSEYALATQTQSSSIVSMTQAGVGSWGFIADAVESELPAVASVIPGQGIVGTGVTIAGTSLTSATTVTFCGTSQSFTVANDTLILATVPQVSSPSRSQICDVVVTNGAGISMTLPADQFSFLPNVASVSPPTGGNGTALTITGSSFVGATGITLCGVSQPRFAVVSDTMIRLNISDLVLTSSMSCDVSVTNSNGKSSTSSNDVFDYVPQNQSGGTTHSPSAPASSSKTLYIIIAGIAAVALAALAGLMRRWEPEKKQPQQVQAQEEPAGSPPLPAR